MKKIYTDEESKKRRIDSQRKYIQNSIKQYTLRFNITTEKDIVDKLESVDSVTKYIRCLILKDIE